MNRTEKGGSCCFTKADRIRKSSDYKRLSAHGKRVKSSGFVFVYQKNTIGRPRLGITASRKTGNAVNRNRIKRIVREYFRTHKTHFHGMGDVNVIVRTAAGKRDAETLRQDLERCLLAIEA
ncbi:ribonuclease P protein component [Desulfosarcina sp. OttesenSCG-928-G10]|nr:ribonuclease P protein component [Desulfosarcina sp. OttesenSCG-928-G10]